MPQKTKTKQTQDFLVAQWLRICLAMQGMDGSSIPSWGTKIPHATGQLSLHAAPTEAQTLLTAEPNATMCPTTKDPA